MKELLLFILGMIVGGLAMTTLMCCLQNNRINKMDKTCLKFKNKNSQVQDQK